MNKILNVSATLVSLLVVGCTADPILESTIDSDMIPISINGSINQIHTKANAEGFVDNDAIGLFAVNYQSNNSVPGTLMVTGNQADNVKYVYSEATHKWTPLRSVYYKDANTHVDLFLCYPYQQSIKEVEAYGFEVAKDQRTAASGTALSAYESSDFLWGKGTDITPVESAVRVQMNHILSCLNVSLVEGNGFDAESGGFAAMDKNVIVMNTTRKSTINLSTGVVTPVQGVSESGIILNPQSSTEFRGIIVPQTVSSNNTLLAITVEGISYKFNVDSDITFIPGKMTNLSITVDRNGSDGTYSFSLTSSSISDWTEDVDEHGGEARQYYVVNVETAGTLQSLIEGAGKNPAKIKNLKVMGSLTQADFVYMRDVMVNLQAVNMKEVTQIKHVSNAGSYGDDMIPTSAFANKQLLYHFDFPDWITSIGNAAFSGSSLTGALVIPDSVTKIGESAFAKTKITSLSLPQNITEIPGTAFMDCNYLTGELSLPNGITRIGIAAFRGCAFTGHLELPESLEVIEEQAFNNCGHFIGGLRFPDKVTKLPGRGDGFTLFSNVYGEIDLNNVTELTGCIFSNISGEVIIPEGTKVVGDASNGYGGGPFEGTAITSVKFPSTLISVGKRAFAGSRICEDIEIPEGVVEIYAEAFNDCRFMTGMTLPSTIQIINSAAFRNCSALTKLVCSATEPPVLAANAFDGVPKDNFTLEVPEGSVTKYRSASGWGDFKRIEAHQDFSISRNYFEVLNPRESAEYTLRCPSTYSWSIESKPDWVTVTPDSGTGKATVTITVDELTKGSDNRSGDIVFLMNAKDYRSTMKVSQYNYAYADGDVLPLFEHTKGNGVKIVLLGDCYDASDIASGNYLKNLTDASDWLFNIEPYKTYKEYFDVYVVFGKSEDSGIGTVNTIKSAKFGSQYTVNAGVAPNSSTCFEYACKAPINGNVSNTLIILIENTTQYGGITYLWGDGSAIAVCPMSGDAYPFDFRGIVQHEAGGHGFGKLVDEYIYVNGFINGSCSCLNPHLDALLAYKELGWARNLEVTGNMNEVGWSHLIFNPQYSNYVDVFEGGFFHTRGVYRSESTSCMNNNIPYYSAISRQAIVERIMQYAGEVFSLESFYAKDKSEFGPRTKASMLDWGVKDDYTNGKQREPVYMGEHPEFKHN